MIQIECHSREGLLEAIKNLENTNEKEVNVILSNSTIYLEAPDHEDQEYVPFIRSWESLIFHGKPEDFRTWLLKDPLILKDCL